MANFCGKCGSPLGADGHCPKCDSSHKENTKVPLKAPEKKSNKNKRKVVVILVVITALVLSAGIGCAIYFSKKEPDGINNKAVKEQIEKDTAVFSAGNINEINKLLFSTPDIPDELKEFSGNTVENNNSFMGALVSLSEIKISSSDDQKISVSVTAPDLSNFGEYILKQITFETTEEDLRNLILEYAESCERLTTEIELEYSLDDGRVIIDYSNPDFINAITGNIKEGYAKIYEQYLSELNEVVTNND